MSRNPIDCGMTSAVKGNGVGVTVRNNNIETALQILKKKIKNERVLIIYKESLSYQKPSEKRRKARMISKIRSRKQPN